MVLSAENNRGWIFLVNRFHFGYEEFMSQAVSLRSRQQLHMARMLMQMIEPAQANLQRQALEEAVVFHLYGGLQHFLQELNELYAAGASAQQLSAEHLAQALKAQGRAAPAVNELMVFSADEHSWYSLLSVKYHQISQVDTATEQMIVATSSPALTSEQLAGCLQSVDLYIQRAREGLREY
ncbi:hypothetical protein DC094_19190 [Pelagibaculum spongiae]|uniref:Uncharacterized protein n=2 Tax=Pelagibaculum spongiae TaxID=2080658 RepID=A0A2V1GPN4_9GAMM|nr:hypothetical protein DC094_19190 [Pelagibaculum spongiae]